MILSNSEGCSCKVVGDMCLAPLGRWTRYGRNIGALRRVLVGKSAGDGAAVGYGVWRLLGACSDC